MSDVTRDELRDLRDDIVELMTRGFDGVNLRLDKLNGRVGTSEVAIASGNVRVTNLEREVFKRRESATDDADAHALTLADLKWYLAVAGGSIGGTYWALHVMGLLK